MAFFEKQVIADADDTDWCHLCGTRQRHNVVIWYASNAEHQPCDSPREAQKFLRVCAACGRAIAAIGAGEIEGAIRNNPALARYRREEGVDR